MNKIFEISSTIHKCQLLVRSIDNKMMNKSPSNEILLSFVEFESIVMFNDFGVEFDVEFSKLNQQQHLIFQPNGIFRYYYFENKNKNNVNVQMVKNDLSYFDYE